MGLDHDQTMAAITGNNPEIRPMQCWILYAEDGRPMKRLRILAKHPEPHGDGVGHHEGGRTQWIYRTEVTHGTQVIELMLEWIPEYNLRRLFTLDEDPIEALAESRETLGLPYAVFVEAGPEQSPFQQIFYTSADVDRLARDLHGCIHTLEGIASFASGTAGDEAMNQLKRMGAWSERVQST